MFNTSENKSGSTVAWSPEIWSLPLSLSLPLLLLLTVTPLQGAEVTVTCTDTDDANTCSIDGPGSYSTGFVDNIRDIIEGFSSPAAGGTQINERCSATGDTNTYRCNVSVNPDPSIEVNLLCTFVPGGATAATTASCEYEADEDLFDMSCTEVGNDGGECTITSGLSEIARNVPLSDYSTVLESGCASLEGTEQYQSDCAVVLSNQNNAETIAEEIVPANADAAITTTLNSVSSRLEHVLQRQFRLRTTSFRSTDIDVAGLNQINGEFWGPAGTLLAANHSDTQTDAVLVESDSSINRGIGFFLDGSLLSAQYQDNPEESGADQDTQLLTWGFDYRINSEMFTGLAFSGSFSDVDFNRGRGDLLDTGLLLTAFGSYYKNNLYVDLSFGAGGNDYKQRRELRCDAADCGLALDQTATSEFTGRQYTFAIAAGYDITRGALSITPFGQFIGTRVEIEAYSETMSSPTDFGGGFAQTFDEQILDSSVLTLGARFTYVLSRGWGVLIPRAALELKYSTDSDPLFVEGGFVGNTGDSDDFTLRTRELDQTYAIVSGGAVLQLKNNLSTFGDIRILAGHDQLDQYQVTLGVRREL